MKKVMVALLLILAFPLRGAPITINDPTDYHVLDQFFRAMIKEEVFGYVLEGTKPLSALNIYLSNHLRPPNSRFFHWDVLAKEAIEVWKKTALEQKKYIFKATKTFNPKFGGSYYELVFINRQKLRETIDDNLDLFRFHLGPVLESSTLVELIADSSRSLDSVIKGNNTLMGILLGYGTHNSLMGGRLEEIQGAHGSLDRPPFLGDYSSQEARETTDRHLQNYFLSCTGSSTYAVTEKSLIEPGVGCSSLQEELDKILLRKEQVPITLLRGNPAFVFGAYKSVKNQKLFEGITRSQKRIQALLSRSDLLEIVLEKISGEKPLIKCSPFSDKKGFLSVEKDPEEAVAETVWSMAQELDKETQSTFVDAFCHFNSAVNNKPKFGTLPGVLDALKQAQINLQIAENQILTWSKTKDVKEIIPQGLYFECIKPGEGLPIDKPTDLLLSYVIEDGLGHVLSAEHNCWISPSQTIPGFAHGIKGMREGETRHIYIHPAYGYGALTTLPPCVSLIVKVTLHQVGEVSSSSLPTLKPIDLSWVQDPEFFKETKEACYQDARHLGNLWGAWLSKSPDISFSKLCDQLKGLAENKELKSFSKDKLRLCNRIFWNLITEEQSEVVAARDKMAA